MRYVKGLAKALGKSGDELEAELARIDAIISLVDTKKRQIKDAEEKHKKEIEKLKKDLASVRSTCRHEMMTHSRPTVECHTQYVCEICGYERNDDGPCGYDG